MWDELTSSVVVGRVHNVRDELKRTVVSVRVLVVERLTIVTELIDRVGDELLEMLSIVPDGLLLRCRTIFLHVLCKRKFLE